MRKWGIFLLLGLLGFLFLAGCSQGIPESKGFVNDFANLISDDIEKTLELQLIQYEKQSTNEIAIVTVKTIGDKSVEEYTMQLAEKWKVGKKDKDNGVIILVAEKERKVRIEVGYGLEPVLTDAKAKLIIERVMVPRFKAKDYEGGIQAGVNAVIGAIEGSYDPNQAPPVDSGGWPVWVIVVIILGILLLIILPIVLGGDGGNGYWSSGGSGGGSGGGFGGGGFGGGGASGSW